MNRKLLSTFLSCFFAIVFLVVIGCSKSDDSLPAAFSQGDLMGTWNFQILKTDGSTTNGWQRFFALIDASGNLNGFSGCQDSDGNTTCPAANTITWTINASGVITESGTGATAHAHYNMASNKRFVAGTTDDSSVRMLIAQKAVSGTSFTNSDIDSRTFVIHQLMVGNDNMWEYAIGSTDSARTINLSSVTNPGGTTSPGNSGTIAVGPGGFVGIDTLSSFQGFMSSDKKTIVGTYTDNNGFGDDYHLMIIQITTDQSTTAGPLPNATLYGHMLAIGASPAPFWAHYTSTASSGSISFSNVVSSSPSVTAFESVTGATINATGGITFSGTTFSYHGQQSFDGNFAVGTETMHSTTTPIYLMTVDVK
jgi:hypothetical protein